MKSSFPINSHKSMMWHSVIAFTYREPTDFCLENLTVRKIYTSSSLISIKRALTLPTVTPSSVCVSFFSMAFSATLSQNSFSCLSHFPQTFRRNPLRLASIRAVSATEDPEKEKATQTQTKSEESSSNAQPSTAAPKLPKKPVYSSELWN